MQPDEFLRVWLENRELLWNRIDAITRERDTTDELVQELFLRVYPKIDRLDGTALHYAVKAAGNLARSYVRSSYHRRTVGYATDNRTTTATPFDYVHEKETGEFYQQQVEPALRELPEKYRAALAAYTGNERPSRVAKREGIPFSTLRSRKKRAVEMLRERVELKKR